MKIFRGSRKLSDIRAACKDLKSSPLVEIFLAGYREIENQVVLTENPGAPRVRRRALAGGFVRGDLAPCPAARHPGVVRWRGRTPSRRARRCGGVPSLPAAAA